MLTSCVDAYTLVTDFGVRHVEASQRNCITECITGDGKAYAGHESKTRSGKTCLAWNVQTPHKHTNSHVGEHNHCRNPDREAKPWCYTPDEDTRWEFCDIKDCLACHEGKMLAAYLYIYIYTYLDFISQVVDRSLRYRHWFYKN